MNKIDMRRLSDAELFMKRKEVVRLRQTNHSGKATAEIAEISEWQVSRIRKSYQSGGMAVLKPRKRGRKHGEQTLLSREQERAIRQIIIDRTPDQFKMRFMLWTREAVSELCRQQYHLEVSLRCVTNYLKRWGFTCQRPTKQAYFRDNVKAARFMREEYPGIAARAKAERAEIYWGDETGIDNREHYQRGFALRGYPPVILADSKKERINMLSAITNQGSVRFMMFEANMNQKKLIEFMRRLIAGAREKVFFILDNLRVHHGRLVRAWLEKHKDRIEVFFLPPYSPELNPDEYFNHALKLSVHLGIAPRTVKDIRHKAESFVRKLQHNGESQGLLQTSQGGLPELRCLSAGVISQTTQDMSRIRGSNSGNSTNVLTRGQIALIFVLEGR
jgi:transposase